MVPGKSIGPRCNCNVTACKCEGPIRVGEFTLTLNQIQERELAEMLGRQIRSTRVRDWERRLPRGRKN